MLIVSDFHDYYDGMMKHGVDKAVVYQRKVEEINFRDKDTRLKKSDFPFIEELHDKARMYLPWQRGGILEYDANWIMVGVCGRMYAAIDLERTTFGVNDKRPERFTAYSLASITSFVRQHFSKHSQERFFKEPDRFRKKRDPMGAFDHLGVQTFFDFCYKMERVDFFRKINAPVGIYIDRPRNQIPNLIINPRLADWSFQKIMDPHTIYQEISMFISGVLGVGSPATVEISNEDMAAKKGFDKKSFRTDPGTRKPRWLKRQLRDR
jgi:hypothetical protein